MTVGNPSCAEPITVGLRRDGAGKFLVRTDCFGATFLIRSRRKITQFAGNTNELKSDIMKIAAMLSTENRNVDKVIITKQKNKKSY